MSDATSYPRLIGAAIAAAGIVLAAGLAIAIVTPDESLVGRAGLGEGVGIETFRQAVGTLLTAMVDPGLLIGGARRIHPMLLVVIPVGAVALMTRRTPLVRALLVALLFALLMLVFAVAAGETAETQISPSVGGAFALGLLWGVVGALIGNVAIPDRAPLRAALAAGRPLLAIVVICTVVGLAGWLIQVVRDAGGVRGTRSLATALLEETAFAGEHGVHLTSLGASARFRADASGSLGLPFPVDEPNEMPGRDGTFRIYAFTDELPGVVAVPAIIFLLGLLSLGALYAGFAAARAVRAPTLGRAVSWGAITGPTWALAMALLSTAAGGLYHGDADDASVFGIFLLAGAVLGAAGGALAVSGPAARLPPPDEAGTPASPEPSSPDPASRSRP